MEAIRTSVAHVSKSVAHIRESVAHIRKSVAYIRKSVAHIRKSVASIRTSIAHIRSSDVCNTKSIAAITFFDGTIGGLLVHDNGDDRRDTKIDDFIALTDDFDGSTLAPERKTIGRDPLADLFNKNSDVCN